MKAITVVAAKFRLELTYFCVEGTNFWQLVTIFAPKAYIFWQCASIFASKATIFDYESFALFTKI